MANEHGWLIERTDLPNAHWLALDVLSDAPEIRWLDDANRAMRFYRKRDAEIFCLLHPQRGFLPVITEHVWVDGSAAPTGDKP
jgi:hypothetical protein